MADKVDVSTLVDFAHGQLTPEESLNVLNSIEGDPEASRDLDLVVELMNEANDPRSDLFTARKFILKPTLAGYAKSLWQSIRLHPVAYPAGAIGSVAIAFALMLFATRATVSRWEDLTGIDRTAFTWNARGTDNSDIAGAYLSFTTGDYEKSLALLNRHLREEPEGSLSPYVHYAAGVVGLMASKSTYLGIVQTRDRQRIVNALDQLAVGIAQSPNRRLSEECRFLRAKGYLMLEQPGLAIIELDSVRALGGSKSEEATQMIERIHALTP